MSLFIVHSLQCLVIGEITCGHMIVVLNKTDLIEESKREAQIAKVTVSVFACVNSCMASVELYGGIISVLHILT